MRALIVKQAYIPVLLEDLINKKYAMVDLASSHGITDDSEILDTIFKIEKLGNRKRNIKTPKMKYE